jgi:subtilase family serine protease
MKIARQQLLDHVFDAVSKLKPVGPLAESMPINLVIALPAQNVESRTALLRDIYDPASPRFRQFLSPDQYIQRFDPTEASYQSLLDFAKANQLTVVSTAPPKVHPCNGTGGSHQPGVPCDVAAVSTPD